MWLSLVCSILLPLGVVNAQSQYLNDKTKGMPHRVSSNSTNSTRIRRQWVCPSFCRLRHWRVLRGLPPQHAIWHLEPILLVLSFFRS